MAGPTQCPRCAFESEAHPDAPCPRCKQRFGPARLDRGAVSAARQPGAKGRARGAVARLRAWFAPEAATVGSRLVGLFLLLGAAITASAWLPGPGARGVSVPLAGAALLDVAVGVGLVSGRRWAHGVALARVLLGLALLLGVARTSLEPLTFGLQLFLAGGALLLLLGTPERVRLGVGVLLCAGGLTLLGLQASARFTQRSPLAESLLDLRNALEPGLVKTGVGQGWRYQLTFPPTGWRQARAPYLQELSASADRIWLRPASDAAVSVRVRHLPAAGAVDLDAVVAHMLEARQQPGAPDVEVLDTRPLEGSFDAGRLLHLRERTDAGLVESHLALMMRGDHAFSVHAFAPHHRFPALDRELADIVTSFAYEPPRLPRLSRESLERVQQATVLVLAGESSGSGFVVHREAGRLFLVTNHHVIHPPGSRKKGAAHGLQVVLRDAGGPPRTMAAIEVKSNEEWDLALLSIRDETGPREPLAMVRSASLPERTPLFAAGFPFGQGLSVGKAPPSLAVNSGWLGRESPEALQHKGQRIVDVGINPGNSGGPVVDSTGRVMGVAVAHLRGSEVSMMVSSETLEAFLDVPGGVLRVPPTFDPGPVAPPEPEEDVAPVVGEARARAATVLVRSESTATAGVVVGRDAERLLVVASLDALGATWRPGLPVPALTVTVRPAQSDASPRPAKLLRYSTVAAMVLLSVAEQGDGIEPLVPSGTLGLETGGPLSVFGFRLDESSRLQQLHPVLRLMHGAVASLRRDALGTMEMLQVDVGINRGQSGGPVLNPAGQLVALAVTRVENTNVSLALPGERITEFLQGGLAGGAWKFVHDAEGRCALQALAKVEDPLGALTTLRLRVEPDSEEWSKDPQLVRHVRALEDVLVSEAVDGRGSVVLTAEVPCPLSSLRVQLEVSDSSRTRRTLASLVPIQEARPGMAMGFLGGTSLSGGEPPDVLEFLLSPLEPPAAWRQECAEDDTVRCQKDCKAGQARACARLGRWHLRTARTREAEEAFARGCGQKDVESCVELGFLVNRGLARRSRPEAEVAARMLGELCERKYERACLATTAGEFDKFVRELERRCTQDADACRVLGFARLLGPGGPRANVRMASIAFSRACAANTHDACYWDAQLGVQDWGLPGSLEASARTFQSGCEQRRHARSCVALASLYAQGRGMPKSLDEARRLMRLACKLGDASSCAVESDEASLVAADTP